MINPWVIVAALAALGLSYGSGYFNGARHRADEIEAQIGRDAAVAARVEEAAQAGAAKAIAKIEMKTVNIRGKTEKIIEQVPVLRDCTAPDSLRELTDEALAGKSAGDSELPGANPDAGGDVR